ncbi:MAG: RNA polymerase sigma factor [Chloroflexota bacterium]
MAVELPPISRLRAQDHQAFGALVDRHYEPVQRYLARLVGDAEVAAELTQETFLRAYQALPRLADDSNVGGWLFRIATNLARQHHRHRQLIGWSRLECPDALGAPGRSLEDDVVRQDLVRQALAQLPLDQRVCLLLYAWTGYTCAEIGEIVGRSTDAVRMLLVRARRRFRAAYDDVLDWLDRDDGANPGTGNAGTGGTGAPQAGTKRGDAGGTATMEDERTQRSDSDCRVVEEALPFYPRGDLRRDTFSAVTRHLADCLRCRHALLDVQATYCLLQWHLNTAPVGGVPAAKAAVMARLDVSCAAPLAAPLFEAPAPARVLVRPRRRDVSLPWPGFDAEAPGHSPLSPWERRTGGRD